ncbi:MAG: ATP-binding protein [Bdellovibrionaceae bacterium]|nr:ATP-binding protein [Pseudobdellovibrionaceae bacterium]
MFKRIVKLSKSHSFFLFGARATGKSTLIQESVDLSKTIYIDLLDPETEEFLSDNPSQLKNMLAAQPDKKLIIIDEIQKNIKLLDVVHQLTKNKNLIFMLTGSSARKLKRGSANLLAGRAFNYTCHPLTHIEIDKRFNLNEVLQYGSLPEIFSLNENDKQDYLRAYVDIYFKEEIVAEQIIRKLKPFKNFLSVAAQMNGKVLNINKIALDVGVDHSTIQNYFEILEDTMVGFHLEPFHESIRKRQRKASKFYYFDLGVTRTLKKLIEHPLTTKSYEYGDAFEHFIILEIKRLIDYKKPDWTLSYLSTKDNAKIDLIIERPKLKTVAIEIKSTDQIASLSKAHLNVYSKLISSLNNGEGYIFSQDPIEQKIDNIWCLPWKKGFKEIGLLD